MSYSSKLALLFIVVAGAPVAAQPTEPTAPQDPVPVAAPAPPAPIAVPVEAPVEAPSVVAPKVPVVTAPAPAASTAPDITGVPGKGLTITTGERFSLNLRSRIQVRYSLGIPAEDASGDRKLDQLVNIGTARLWLSGHAYRPELTYMVQLALAGRDYRDGAVSPIFDAFLDWKAHRDVGVRVGQFFVPFDRLRTVRELALQLTDRPRPVTELTLDRDVGVTLYSDRFLGDSSPVAWKLGAFGGGGTNLSTGKEPGLLVVARVELRPLGAIDDDSEGDLERRRKPGLAIGAAFAGNWNTNRLRSTTGGTFTGGTTDYKHAAVDLVFKWRGAAFQAEYLWKRASNDQIVSTHPDGTSLIEYTRSARGWVLQGSYTFDPPFELVGRLSRLYTAGGTDPRLIAEVDTRGQEIAVGVNRYLNGHRLKLQADWIARTTPDFELGNADHLVHVQLDATF